MMSLFKVQTHYKITRNLWFKINWPVWLCNRNFRIWFHTFVRPRETYENPCHMRHHNSPWMNICKNAIKKLIRLVWPFHYLHRLLKIWLLESISNHIFNHALRSIGVIFSHSPIAKFWNRIIKIPFRNFLFAYIKSVWIEFH